MGGKGIGIKCIKHQYVKFLFRHLFDRKTSISHQNVAVVRAAAQEREEILGNIMDLRINIEKRDVPVRQEPPCHASCPQSDDTDVLIWTVADHFHHIAD